MAFINCDKCDHTFHSTCKSKEAHGGSKFWVICSCLSSLSSPLISHIRKNNKGCQHKERLCVASSNVTSVDTHFTRQANLKKRMETESSGSFALISSLSTSAHLNAHFIFTRQANLKKRKKNNKGCQHKEHPCVQQTRTQLTPSLRRTCPLTGEKNLLSTTIYSRALVRKLIAKYGLQSFLFQSTKLGMIILVVH